MAQHNFLLTPSGSTTTPTNGYNGFYFNDVGTPKYIDSSGIHHDFVDNDLSNYYTKPESNSNFLSASTSFYTQAESNSNFLSASTSYVAPSTLNNYYTSAQCNSNFLSASTSVVATDTQALQYYYLKTECNSNFLSASTSVVATNTQALQYYYLKTEVYNTGQTYSIAQVDALLTGVTSTAIFNWYQVY